MNCSTVDWSLVVQLFAAVGTMGAVIVGMRAIRAQGVATDKQLAHQNELEIRRFEREILDDWEKVIDEPLNEIHKIIDRGRGLRSGQLEGTYEEGQAIRFLFRFESVAEYRLSALTDLRSARRSDSANEVEEMRSAVSEIVVNLKRGTEWAFDLSDDFHGASLLIIGVGKAGDELQRAISQYRVGILAEPMLRSGTLARQPDTARASGHPDREVDAFLNE